ncbi:hypothetical protein JHK86_020145 [Glycine max]|uniref:CAP-Gly domain-containing protein n=1 Tax=Glycine max TaxID=3847 RepID=I1KP64_SOYBN|nr:hypothetical protein JHK86_020145 [Glycine max]
MCSTKLYYLIIEMSPSAAFWVFDNFIDLTFIAQIPDDCMEDLSADIKVGVQYDEPLGKHDGMVKGVSYFECPPSHSGMVRPEKVKVGDTLKEIPLKRMKYESSREAAFNVEGFPIWFSSSKSNICLEKFHLLTFQGSGYVEGFHFDF